MQLQISEYHMNYHKRDNILYLEDYHGKSHVPIRLLTIQKFAQQSPSDYDRALHQQSAQNFLMEMSNEAKA